MTKKTRTRLISSIVVLLVIFISSYFQFDSKPSLSNSPVEDIKQYEVIKVIDGDTIRVDIDGQNEKIRLLQVNTPEVTEPNIPMGKVASEFTENFLKGKKVSLEYDKEKTDQYGRLLCYVFITDENGKQLCLNEELVRNGLAKVVRYGKNTLHYDDYKIIEKEAKKQNLGIWQDIKANYPPKHK